MSLLTKLVCLTLPALARQPHMQPGVSPGPGADYLEAAIPSGDTLLWDGVRIAPDDFVDLKPEPNGTLNIPVTTDGKLDSLWSIDSNFSLAMVVEAGKAQGLRVTDANSRGLIIATAATTTGVVRSKKFPITREMKMLDGLRIIGNGDMANTYVSLKVSIDGGPIIVWAKHAPTSLNAFDSFRVDLSKVHERASSKPAVGQLELVDGSASRLLGISASLPADTSTPPLDRDISRLSLQAKVATTAESWRKSVNAPGVWVGVVKRGQPVACVAVGHAAIQGKQATDSDLLSLGSVSKPLSALTIAAAVDKGMMTWDFKVRDVFPEWATQAGKSPSYNSTVAQLITHVSTLPTDPEFFTSTDNVSDATGWRKAYSLNGLRSKPIGLLPGSTHHYSNVGPVVAAAMLERLTGESFESLMKRLVFEPLGLKSARMIDYASADCLAVTTYYSDTRGLISQGKPLANPYLQYSPAGGIQMSLSDLIRVVRFFSRYRPENRIISADTFYKLTNYHQSNMPVTLGGWYGNPQMWLTHGGSTGRGEQCVVWVGPKSESGYAFYCNVNESDGSSTAHKRIEDQLRLLLE